MNQAKTRITRLLAGTCLAAATLLPSTASATIWRTDQGVQLSGLYVFGDSLSDSGNIAIATGGAVPNAAAGYYAGRFSNGPIYLDYIANAFNLHNTAALAGGTNFAFGGAKIDAATSPNPLGLLAQGQFYLQQLAGHAADPNALYVVYGGGNDINDPNVNLGTSISNLSLLIGALINQGARNIVVPNAPDLGRTPGNNGNPATAALKHSRSVAFNTLLGGAIAGLESAFNIDIIEADVFGLSTHILDNPGLYGLSDVVDACLSAGGACANPSQYFYWDSIHPTAGMHQLFGESIIAQIDAAAVPVPPTSWLMSFGLIGLWQLRRYRRR